MNLSELILSANDLGELKPVSVPQWGGTEGKLFVRHMTAKQKAAWMVSFKKFLEGEANLYKAQAAAFVLVDAEGKRIFADTQVEALAEKNEIAVELIFNAWQALDVDEKNTVEAQKKD